MYKKMLVALDTSEFAECVFEHVKEIATARAIPDIVLLGVIEPVRTAAMAYFGDDEVKKSEAKAKESMLHYLSDAKEKLSLGSSNVSTVVLLGDPATEILKYVENNGVDLLVMSSHGRSGVSKWFLGSVVERVLRASVAPVFLVPSMESRLGAR